MKTFRIILGVALASLVSSGFAEDKSDDGWSAELLNRILRADTPQPMKAPPPDAEMALHTYQLAHLRVGEAGKAQNVLTILRELLPAGSSINSDVPANSIHVLTTPVAHKAVWDYLSAVDIAEPAASAAANALPDDVKTALKKLAEADDRSARVLAAVGALKSDVANEIAQIDARQRRRTLHLVVGVVACGVLVAATLSWMLRRRVASPAAVEQGESRALTLASEQLTTALTPVHEKMRSDMLGLLNEVAIKLQAQHHEQQKLVREQQCQLEDARHALVEERRQFISEAGTMVVQAVERVDATTAKLARQQDKVAELVQELQNTVRELDDTKDDLRQKQIELEQERAKIAALSILLEEGGALPPSGEVPPPSASVGDQDVSPGQIHPATPSRPPSTATPPCMTPDHTTTPVATVAPPLKTSPAEPFRPHRYTFLPPDHPES